MKIHQEYRLGSIRIWRECSWSTKSATSLGEFSSVPHASHSRAPWAEVNSPSGQLTISRMERNIERQGKESAEVGKMKEIQSRGNWKCSTRGKGEGIQGEKQEGKEKRKRKEWENMDEEEWDAKKSTYSKECNKWRNGNEPR